MPALPLSEGLEQLLVTFPVFGKNETTLKQEFNNFNKPFEAPKENKTESLTTRNRYQLRGLQKGPCKLIKQKGANGYVSL